MANMVIVNSEFANKVSSTCEKKLHSLGKMGKPKENEYILFACFIEVNSGSNLPNSTLNPQNYCLNSSYMKVVSLGTGSKCIGASKIPPNGNTLHDSHAEIIARRAFKVYLLYQIENCIEGKASIFNKNKDGKFGVKTGLSYHFYTNQTPCGDASIISEDNEKGIRVAKKIKLSKTNNLVNTENGKYTGAKVVGDEEKDVEFWNQVGGALRTKPGKGERTLSHSCSDKIFKWIVLGVQGAIVMHLLDCPIYLTSIVVGKGLYDSGSFYRAIYNRFAQRLRSIDIPNNFSITLPSVIQTNTNRLSKDKDEPSQTSIIWSDTRLHQLKHECAVNGRKQGLTKKDALTEKGNVSICRQEIGKFALGLYRKQGLFKEVLIYITYAHFKDMSKEYQALWDTLKNDILKKWTKKPDYAKLFFVG